MTTDRAPRILVLEDEWLIANQIETALDDAGFEVVGPFNRVAQAVDVVHSLSVDAAILDINVNGESSFPVAEKLVEASVPFMFLSGYSEVELPSALQGRPMVQKPIDLTALCRYLRSLMQSPTGSATSVESDR